MRQFVLIICISGFCSSLFAQGENNIWCFGNHAGLDFNTTPATPLYSKLEASEGTASISDPSGSLLFYSDGITIWDRNHNVMPNGTGLNGGMSSTQAVLIVPKPKSNKIYYVFTTEDNLGNGGLYFSIVNMDLNGGFGDIEVENKNILLFDGVGEKVNGILHANGIDIWILSHKLNSNEFLSYLLTESGLNLNPVISSIGSTYSHFDPIGPIRSSHRGDKVICTATQYHFLEMFDFNKSTGMLSNFVDLYHLFTEEQSVYGIEFSPNDSLIYVTSYSNISHLSYIFQIDPASNSLVEIAHTQTASYGAALLGSDDQIYVISVLSEFLNIIHHPNNTGLNCDYEPDAIQLKPGSYGNTGLPNLIPYAFFQDYSNFSLGNDTSLCTSDSLVLELNYPIHCDSINYLWSNDSKNAELVVRKSGIYWLEVSSPCLNFRDTIMVNFYDCLPIIHYDLNACRSVMADGSNMDYSEFTPEYPTLPHCAEVIAENLYRKPDDENKHSCTPGINSSLAVCVTALKSCQFDPGNIKSILIDFSVNPLADSTFQLSGFQFFEKAPLSYNWINGGSGSNDYPLLYGLRVLKNNIEVFRKDSIKTNRMWTLQKFDLLNDTSFSVKTESDFRIELLPYCAVGIPSDVSAWDIDEVSIFGGCRIKENKSSTISGQIKTQQDNFVHDAVVQLVLDSNLISVKTEKTNQEGEYTFNNLLYGPYILQCSKNDDVLNGVSTLDLIYLQRYLLGLEKFESYDKYIAADINNDKIINVIDLLELRKAILGISSTFTNNKSWRFGVLPISEVFSDYSQFKENDSIIAVNTDTIISNFVGVKVGDLNGDVKLLNEITVRSAETCNLYMTNIKNNTNNCCNILFSLHEQVHINGFQFSMDLNELDFLSISSDIVDISNENISLIDNILRVSWNSQEAINVLPGSVLFKIKVKDLNEINAQVETVSFSDDLNPEIYLDNLKTFKLAIAPTMIISKSSMAGNIYISQNPACQQIALHFELSKEQPITIRIFDLSGRCIFQSKKKYMQGQQMEVFGPEEILGSGLFAIQLGLEKEVWAGKFIYIK